MRPGRRVQARLTAAAALLVAHGVAAAADAGAGQPAFDNDRPRWTELEFRASKFLLTANARVDARIRPSAEIAGQLVTTPTGRPVPPGPAVLEMAYRASGLGRESLTTLWADPVSGATLQRTQLDTGSRQRTYRFADIGAYHYTRRPAGNSEEKLPPERWTQRSEGARPYSPSAVGKPVTEATVLLWLAAAANLEKTGDALEALTFSRRHVNRVRLEVTGRRSVAVDFSEKDPGGTRQRRGKTEAIVMRLRGSPLDAEPGDDEAFELLGLHGDLELLLDPRTRAPLELSGDVKVAGKITVRLRRAVLR